MDLSKFIEKEKEKKEKVLEWIKLLEDILFQLKEVMGTETIRVTEDIDFIFEGDVLGFIYEERCVDTLTGDELYNCVDEIKKFMDKEFENILVDFSRRSSDVLKSITEDLEE
jgi:hypothetical protein